jgi:4a-hydroxytetrahydrobiopterin dehydratase
VSLPRVILIRVSTPQGWSEVDGALQREFRFANFADALAFVNRVGALAEAENHHPDVELGWGRVVLRWRTHSADAITDRDRELAEKSGRL